MPALEWRDVAVAWAAMAVHLVGCARLDRALAKGWFWASLRATAQLCALGYVLAFLFRKDSWAWTSLAMLGMMGVSTWTVFDRTEVRYPGLIRDCFLALSASLLFGMAPLLFLFGDSESLRKTAVVLPFLGILLGNSLSGLSLGLAQWLRELRQRQNEVEFWISLGASPAQGSAKLNRSAFRTAMTPILNSLAVAGVVSLPGMMTGQLLAGGSPNQAVRYQLVVLFLISGVIFSSLWLALHLGLRRAFDPWGALQLLTEREKK